MSKFDEKVSTYEAAMDKMGGDYDKDLLTKVAKGLGPSIYNSDSNKVACSDKTELERVVNNFVVKKLGMDKAKGEEAVKTVCANYTERAKHRAIFYYMVVKELGAEDHYA